MRERRTGAFGTATKEDVWSHCSCRYWCKQVCCYTTAIACSTHSYPWKIMESRWIFRWFPYFPCVHIAVSGRIWFVHYGHLVLTKQFMIKLRLRLEWRAHMNALLWMDGMWNGHFFSLASWFPRKPAHSWGF